MNWIDQSDNRRWLTQLFFVAITLGLLVYLHLINEDGTYKELIVGIIGMFIGVASTSAKDLISGKKDDEIEVLRGELHELQLAMSVKDKEIEIYKALVADMHQRLVDKMEL